MKKTLLFFVLLTSIAYGETPEDYANLRKNFVNIYAPIVKKFNGADFEVSLSTDYPDNVGGIDYKDGKAIIQFGSEFHNNPKVTLEIYAAILCHEVGHLLGGEPKKNQYGGGKSWASMEAQSDYYSSAICLKKLFPLVPLLGKKIVVPTSTSEKCRQAYKTDYDIKLCERTAFAGYSLMTFLYSIFSKYGGPDKYNYKPELTQIELSNESSKHEYPNLQCRLDTIIAGSLCNEKAINGNDGICDHHEGYELGLRPSCWYIP